jgi:divalent metal cation (Fe/Co/Zn/Cd) transporter
MLLSMILNGIRRLRRRLMDIDYSKKEVETLLEAAEIRPAVHQLEKHPYLPQNAFCKWHKEVSPLPPPPS